MTHLLRAFAVALAATFTVCAHAQSAAPAPDAGLQAPADDRLFRELGGRAGVTQLADAFVPRLVADAHLGEFFKHVPPEPLKSHLAQMLCVVSGGGCAYEGRSILEVHKDMDISRTDFNAVVRVLQDTMDAQQIPFATQNRLLARLAPMHREIVTTH